MLLYTLTHVYDYILPRDNQVELSVQSHQQVWCASAGSDIEEVRQYHIPSAGTTEYASNSLCISFGLRRPVL